MKTMIAIELLAVVVCLMIASSVLGSTVAAIFIHALKGF